MQIESEIIVAQPKENTRFLSGEDNLNWRGGITLDRESRNERAKVNYRRKCFTDPVGAFASRVLSEIRVRSKRLGIICEITKQDLLDVYPKDGKCPVLGGLFCMATGDGLNHNSQSSPSVDRIRPLLGYVPGNIAIISRRANAIKNDASPDEIRRVLEWLENTLQTTKDTAKKAWQRKRNPADYPNAGLKCMV